MATRILAVDDEPYITDLLRAALNFAGYTVSVAASGGEALSMARNERPDLVLLDVMLPDIPGTEVCRRLREQGVSAPVIFLSALDETGDKVAGLALGDDYLTKPFSLDELVARIQAVLRRSGATASNANEISYADLVMNIDTHEVWRHGRGIELTATEFNLLRYLLENARRVLSKSDILNAVWGFDFDGDISVVETYISYLRKKIDTVTPPLIETVRGVGYSLRLPRE
jgi:two-component system OmpR family response regulator